MLITLHRLSTLSQKVPFERAYSHLNAAEQQRAKAITSTQRLHEFTYGRFCVKHALAKALNTNPMCIHLLNRPQGKLYLEGDMVRFNLSHSGDFIALCISHDGDVGIDIEHRTHARRNALAIAQRYFAPAEYHALKTCPPHKQHALFYTIWTQKEAALKAVGTGLSAGIERMNTLNITPHKPYTLTLAHSQHALWLNAVQSPLGFEGVFLATALIPLTAYNPEQAAPRVQIEADC